MRQRKKEFKRFLSVVLSAALTVTSGAFGTLQMGNMTVAKAADSGAVSVPGTDWKLYSDNIAADGAGVRYKLKEGNDRVEVMGIEFDSTFSSKEYEIPATIPVTFEMYKAYFSNSGSDSVVAGESKVTTIADEAFDCATSLEKITIAEGIEKIGKWAFTNNTNLKELGIPKTVVSIGYSTKYATDNTQYEIMSGRMPCKVYFWKDSHADKYFRENAEKYPNIKKEYYDSAPSMEPTASPSAVPTVSPSVEPSVNPSVKPSTKPMVSPSAMPSVEPSINPSVKPSTKPMVSPSAMPSVKPSVSPAVKPSTKPMVSPSAMPSVKPSVSPAVKPSTKPTANPGNASPGNPVVTPGITSPPVFTTVPDATAKPDASVTPSATSIPKPTDFPIGTVKPDQTEKPGETLPTETPDQQQDTVVKQNNVSYQVDQNKNSVAVSDMRDSKSNNVKIPSTVSVGGKEYPVTEIGKNAFAGNKNLKKVTLGKNVKVIEAGAFKGCINLTSIKFPSNLKTVGKNSFNNCKKLKQVSLPRTVKKIGTGAFKNCKSMNKFVLGKKLKQKKGAIAANGQKIRYGASAVKLDISASAFENCVSLRQMVINSLVRKIGNSALKNCKSLRSLIVNSEILREVAKRALKGVHNCKISVPSIKLKPYSVLFKNKGQGKKVIVAKI
ncbi:MAG: leucine-rich repeat protein [Lachnospiraceae bacterium]|nr:leucine-rich repeat protein [Lachnospiraceae bacterium]